MNQIDNIKKKGELRVEALKDKLPLVLGFLEEQLEQTDCSMKTKMQLDLAVEEIFVNIASYAYGSDSGTAVIRVALSENPDTIIVTFLDEGTPFDPLKQEDPDIKKSSDDRQVGGLGVYLVKNLVDGMEYEYKDGKNTLTVTKEL